MMEAFFVHVLYIYIYTSNKTAQQNGIQWGACTLERQETLRSMFRFVKIEIAGAVPQKNSCPIVLVSC